MLTSDFPDYLAAHDVQGEPGLDDTALDAFEQALGVQLGESVRDLYRHCGGISDDEWTVLPMRLMLPAEALDNAAILRDGAAVYHPSPDAVYLFDDGSGNWAGVYVSGPLRGKINFLDHDDPTVAPRFRDVASFLAGMVEADRTGLDWTEMATDYPLSATCDENLVADARPLAQSYLDIYRSPAADPRDALAAVEVALHLLPATEWIALRELMNAPTPFVRSLAIRVAGLQRQAPLIPDLFAYAQRMHADHNYGHWLRAYRALLAIGADEQVDVLHAAADPTWPHPRRVPHG